MNSSTTKPIQKGALKPLGGPEDPRHGTVVGYRYWDCRCAACRAAHAATNKALQEANSQKPVPAHVHGTLNGYNAYRCRCHGCSQASALYRAEYVARKARKALRP